MNVVRPIVVVVVGGVVATLVFIVCVTWYGKWTDSRSATYSGISDGACNIAIVPIRGEIVAYDGELADSSSTTSGDWFTGYVRAAENDLNIQGILVPIDSTGGEPAPSEQMMNVLKRSKLPTAALIREDGDSGAYLAASGANTIIAADVGYVGSIGITYSYLDNTEANKQAGLKFISLASGPFKDSGNPNKPLTDADRALYQRDIKIFKDVFVQYVAQNRNLATTTVDAIADGSVMPAILALQHGLIDQIGDEETARTWFALKLGIDPSDVRFCE